MNELPYEMQLVECYMTVEKRLLQHHHGVRYIIMFWYFRNTEFIEGHFENKTLLKSVLEGGVGFVRIITGLEQ